MEGRLTSSGSSGGKSRGNATGYQRGEVFTWVGGIR